MARNRYINILSMLHFSTLTPANDEDTLYKLKPMIDHLRSVFKEKFTPFQNLCIDESLVSFKGRLRFKQFIPSKRHRSGIKLFMLCDVRTGFILDFIVYCGKGTEVQYQFNPVLWGCCHYIARTTHRQVTLFTHSCTENLTR